MKRKGKRVQDPLLLKTKTETKQKKKHEFDAENSGTQCITHCIKKVYKKDSRDIFTLITF